MSQHFNSKVGNRSQLSPRSLDSAAAELLTIHDILITSEWVLLLSAATPPHEFIPHTVRGSGFRIPHANEAVHSLPSSFTKFTSREGRESVTTLVRFRSLGRDPASRSSSSAILLRHRSGFRIPHANEAVHSLPSFVHKVHFGRGGIRTLEIL